MATGKINKTLAWGMTLVLAGGVLASCSNSKSGSGSSPGPSGSNAGAPVTLTYVSPGSAPTDAAKRFDAINKKLAADGLNIKVDFQFIGWDAWEQKTNLMLSSNEAFDNLTIMEDLIKTSAYAGRGAIVPIDSYLEKYPNLKKAFPDYVWDGMKINGKIYSIPVFYREWANDYEMITYRSDLLKKYNLQPPKTQAEMLAAAEKIKAGEKDMNLNITLKPNTIMNFIHREYEAYPFSVIDDLIYVDQKGNVKSWMETPEFKQDNAFMNALFKKNLINPDILTLPLDQVTKPSQEGTFIFNFGTLYDFWNPMHAAKPEATIDTLRLAPDKAWFRPLLMNNANVIPKTSKHPEEMIKFYDWLYGKQENYDLLAYGIKDDWWKDAGAGKMEQLHPQGTEVGFSEWKLGYYKFVRVPQTAHPKYAETLQINDKAVNSVTVGFTFDTTPVSVEYANLLAEVKTSIYPLKMGVVEYDKFYATALSKMKAAGLDKVVAEYDKQFKAFLAGKK
ncbi:extracellular solute-binding protein [Paenibacillus cymbidii]|uniref:extracellular solute-binding protein n=1 Tax=Paenibacillus cymbidii TaxID=1639034 RepID=UPI001081B258|nr:extracellular solute-binding protein [Paenibacillus cymbidii]